jgi:hypothetical protein
LKLASGQLSEEDLAGWVRRHTTAAPKRVSKVRRKR